jgi:hypothetical protein
MRNPFLVELEFTRAEQAGDPFAFRFAPQEYLLRSAGGGFESGSLNWNQKLLDDLGQARLPGRDPGLLAQLGATLRRFLLPMGWSETEALILEAAAAGRPILLTIRSAAAELFALPWELLLIKSTGQHLGELPTLLLRYEWPETHSLAETRGRLDPGRILLAWSAAGGPVPAEEHRAALVEACRQGHHDFDSERDVLAHASLLRLDQTLRTASQAGAPFAVLHLLCHGAALGKGFGLLLDGEDGAGVGVGVGVDGARLRQLLAPHAGSLRLVVLSACDSGNGGALGNQLGSVAQALHRSGIAAVVASRYPLSLRGSLTLTRTLYEQLLGGLASLEQALLAARQQLATDPEQTEWASLQLYARAADGADTRPLSFRPFRGLLTFQPEHRRFFFGRRREEDEVRDKLQALIRDRRPRFLIVAGASGTGKSSMLLAGVVPRLLSEAEPRWDLARLRPGSDPVRTLEAALATTRRQPRLVCVDQFEESATPRGAPPGRRRHTARLERGWNAAGNRGRGPQVSVALPISAL